VRTVKSASKDIVDTVTAAASFKTFSAALRAAGLVETLKGSGPFTLFVPTDEAFAKLAETTLQEWLRPESKAKLKAILTYHVVPGRLLATEVIKSSSAKTVQGTGLTIRYKDSRMYVNNATVMQTDIACDNGVIHVVDTVMIPS
jgi:transforming growth factor-beta-induced protein